MYVPESQVIFILGTY